MVLVVPVASGGSWDLGPLSATYTKETVRILHMTLSIVHPRC